MDSVKLRGRKPKIMNKELAAMFDDEAELGSEDEEHDNRRKEIDRDDIEENEEGLDKDLEGFIDYNMPNDNDDIHDPNNAALQKYLLDVQNDERERMRVAMRAVVFGHNKKRRFGPQDDYEGLDDLQKRKLERIKEREEQMKQDQAFNGMGEDELERHLMEGGTKRAREAIALKQLAEEEELSEDELRQQVDNTRFYKFMQGRRKQDQVKALAEKEQMMEDEMNKLLQSDDESPKKKEADGTQVAPMRKFPSGQQIG